MGCFDAPDVEMQSTMTGAQKNYLSKAFGQVIPGLANGIDPYTGQRTSGATPLQQQYFAMAPQVANQQLGLLGGLAQSQAPMEAMYNYGQRYANDVITPQTMERFAGMGTANSGGAAMGLGRTLGNYGLGLTSQIGQMGLQNQGQQLQATQAMGQVPGQLGMAGAGQYDIANQQLSAQQRQWQEGQAYNNPWYNIGGSLMGNFTMPVQQSGGMGYSMLSQMGLGQGLGGGGGGAAQALPLLLQMSDRRVKESIEDSSGVLERLRGLKLHTYNYIGHDTRRMGLIAQELEPQFPEAVFERDGVKYVDLYALQSIILAALGELSEVA